MTSQTSYTNDLTVPCSRAAMRRGPAVGDRITERAFCAGAAGLRAIAMPDPALAGGSPRTRVAAHSMLVARAVDEARSGWPRLQQWARLVADDFVTTVAAVRDFDELPRII
jgi:hypothetical protein